MSKIIIWLFLTVLVSGINPGLKISRSLTDSSNLIRSLIPSTINYLTAASLGGLNFNTRDQSTSVSITASSIALTNSTIDLTQTNIIIVQPYYLNVTFSSFTGYISYIYREIGGRINITGTGTGIFNGILTINSEVDYSGGIPQILIDVITLNIVSIYTTNPLLNSAMTTQLTTNMNIFLQTNAPFVLLTLYENKVNSYASLYNYFPLIQNENFYVNSLWNGDPVISYNPIYSCNFNYVTFWYNGTIVTHPSSSAVVPDINPAVSMPDRITTGAGTGYSQMMISQYMIQSYYNALMIKYPYYLVDDVPSNFPNILDTNSGYYPELLKTYGSTAVNLNISFPTAPQIVIIPSIGLKVKVISNVQVLAYNSQLNQWNYPINFAVEVLYLIDVRLTSTYIFGSANKPKLMSINNIKSSIGTIDTYYLGEMISDLFQSLITSYRNQLFFPQISLPYPAGTSFTIPNVDYGNGYLVIYYNPEYAGMTNACLFEEQ